MDTNRSRLSPLAVGLALALSGLATLACSTMRTGPSRIVGCEPEGPARPICGFQNPEDLVALPGGEAILVSEYGSMEGDVPGQLAIFVLDSEQRRVLFRGGEADGMKPTWGDAACPGPPPPAFSPHGIHLSTRKDGALQLLVVQHGGRESVEFFEVEGRGADFSVVWRGCVLAPGRTWLNSVVATPEGGFLATSMMDRVPGETDLAAAFASGVASGYVVSWDPERGFGRLANSEGAMPNGIELSADGRRVFLNSAGEGLVRRLERSTGKVEATARVPGLDNARWAPDGRLVVASALGGSDDEFRFCMALREGPCSIEFEIVAIDPLTMKKQVLYRNAGAPMGGGTVGLVIGDELFIGSFKSDRILRVALD